MGDQWRIPQMFAKLLETKDNITHFPVQLLQHHHRRYSFLSFHNTAVALTSCSWQVNPAARAYEGILKALAVGKTRKYRRSKQGCGKVGKSKKEIATARCWGWTSDLVVVSVRVTACVTFSYTTLVGTWSRFFWLVHLWPHLQPAYLHIVLLSCRRRHWDSLDQMKP